MKMAHCLIVFCLFLLGSCQKEEETIVREDTQSFVKTSPIAGLLSRISQNPTAKDNVLDNSSLISMQLPVTVIVNGNTITINSPDDYQLVQNTIDAYSNDDDVVHCSFPIVIEFQNYATQAVNNYIQMNDAIAACGQDDGFDEIDCISLIYPIVINLYDSNNQIASSVTVTSNSNLFNFLDNLNNNTFVAISFPISAVNLTGQTQVINSNVELSNFMEDAIDDCDDDASNGASGQALLSQILLNDSWNISYCFYDGTNETSNYLGYNFTFHSNKTVVAQRNSSSIDGNWDISDDNDHQRLSLYFDGSSLHNVETSWRVIEYNAAIIKLKKQNSDTTDYLTLTKN